MSEHRPIPLFARRLLPELRRFPSPAAATRSFNAIRRIVSPAPTLGYFGVMDLILLTLPVAIILVAVVLVLVERIALGNIAILTAICIFVQWRAIVGTLRLRRVYQLLLRQDLIDQGVHVCLGCGTSREAGDLPYCDVCNDAWDPTEEHRAIRGVVKDDVRKAHPELTRLPTARSIFTTVHDARQAWQALPRTKLLKRIHTILNVGVAVGIIVSCSGYEMAFIGSLVFLLIAIILNNTQTSRERRFRHAFIITRLAEHGQVICTYCGYDMAVIRERCCPECGKDLPQGQIRAWSKYAEDNGMPAMPTS